MDSVTRRTGTAITVTRAIMVITRAAITAITGVLHTTEAITTLGGRTTTTAATEFTAITSITVITATNCVIRRIADELAWKRFQASFFFLRLNNRLTLCGVREKNPAKLLHIRFPKHRM